MKFRSVVTLEGKTATGIQVPDEVVAALDSGKRPAVTVTIGSYSYRTTVAPMGGQYWVPLSAANRTAAGVAAGDELEVGIELDNEPREIVAPDDFATALSAEPEALKFFEGLSYSNKRRLVLQLDDAKTAETRLKRIAKFIEQLKAGKA
ncbi:YdeI/OmpD-associated family protein [Paenibacillus koleovorans]|uniref:YdeI/OmpD-associated family protein n=1 Tax=Paenibacillus koleovorans TaxID=121608 RepID=UPI000FD7A4CF|nr:YdeI/OmpD-associated family protein [Paenibacillus koleovorans]